MLAFIVCSPWIYSTMDLLRAYFILGPVQNTSDMMANKKNTVLALSLMKLCPV